ncbi:MAG: CPBP family intramembrane glutamic endopeptidase [Anaerolineaceae bacterium]|nr:CPBP family intramembrane glutamic endopeptidase [Anaerolineaceae bacterium]
MRAARVPFPAWMALGASALGTLGLLYLGALHPQVIPAAWTAPLVGNAFVDGKLKYQLVTLVLALIVLGVVALLAPHNARRFYRPGDLDAGAQPVRWLGIHPQETWTHVGRSFAVIVSLATGAFVYFNLAQGQRLEAGLAGYLPWILVLAALNAFTEEAITRLGVITALDGRLARPSMYWISALLFGIPHYYGVPGGLIGACMAVFLGWLLAKSVAETRGLMWAWLIHALQDVIIFAGLFLAAG